MRCIRLGVFELILIIISTFIAYNVVLFHLDLNDLAVELQLVLIDIHPILNSLNNRHKMLLVSLKTPYSSQNGCGNCYNLFIQKGM